MLGKGNRQISAACILQEVETIDHRTRMGWMVELGREARTDPVVAAALEALEAGGFLEKRLALQSCYGSGDAARVLRLVEHPPGILRAHALRLVPLLCDDDQAVEALLRVEPGTRDNLIRRLRRARRQAPVDAFLEVPEIREDPRFPRLLPFGSLPLVARYAEHVFEGAAEEDWRRLARLHPAYAAGLLIRRSRDAARHDRRLLRDVNAAIPTLAKWDPDSVVELVRTLAADLPLSQMALEPVVQRRPGEVAALILASDEPVDISFRAVAHRLEPAVLLELAGRRAHFLGLGYDTSRSPAGLHAADGWQGRLNALRWFGRLSPDLRQRLFEERGHGWQSPEGVINPAIVGVLPGPLREQEARRHLQLPALATRPVQRFPYHSFLPWDEAREAGNRDQGKAGKNSGWMFGWMGE